MSRRKAGARRTSAEAREEFLRRSEVLWVKLLKSRRTGRPVGRVCQRAICPRRAAMQSRPTLVGSGLYNARHGGSVHSCPLVVAIQRERGKRTPLGGVEQMALALFARG